MISSGLEILRYFRLTLQLIGAVTLASAIAAALALTILPNWLQYRDKPAEADYVFPLAGSNSRLLTAIDLYKKGYAPKILLDNERIRPESRFKKLMVELGYPRIDPHELRSRVLAYEGVPKDAVLEFGKGLVSTVEEAEALHRFLGDRPFTAIIVPSPSQARRAKLIFEDKIPNARFYIVPTLEGAIKPQWWRDQDSAMKTLTATAKVIYFWLGGAFRSTDPHD